MEIGDLCKLNGDELIYKITDVKTKNLTLKPDENTTHQIIERFYDIEAIEDSTINAKNIPIYNLSEFKD